MSRSSPERLTRFLAEIREIPKKGLSQNFLIDGNIIRKILSESQVQEGEWVLEIGPGFGALTEGLVSSGAHVIALEKDPKFATTLSELPLSHLEITDARTYPLQKLSELGWEGKGRMIANLPYHITTPLLIKIFSEAPHMWKSVTVMVQDEVARRIVAQPGNKDYGSLTIFLQFFAHVRYAFKVRASCFYPQPQVHSAVVHMEVKKHFPLPETVFKDFFTLTRTAFQQRRKYLTNTLKDLFPKELLLSALQQLRISDKARPETLSLEDYLALFKLLSFS